MDEIKVKLNGYWYPVKVTKIKELLFLKFSYNMSLIQEIKVMDGARWHPDQKLWSIKDNLRNWFQLNFLMGKNPYKKYDSPLIDFIPKRTNLYAHQIEMVRHILTRNYCIIAGEMGTGKTLAAIEAAEALNMRSEDVWYIGPKSGVFAVERELNKWECSFKPRMMTYEKLVKILRTWEDDWPAPKFLILDESSKIKNPTAKRSQCAMAVANAVRAEHKENGYVVLLSGTPAPRTPEDWWHQAEVAMPGFIREGNIFKFKGRLCVTEEKESMAGGVYKALVSWYDNELKCKTCSEFEEHENHIQYFEREEEVPLQDVEAIIKAIRDGIPAPEPEKRIVKISNPNYHSFEKSINEVQKLYKRMAGLVLVKFKKDCLDLPEKQYKVIHIKPTANMLRAAKAIAKNARRSIQALSLLRELSDGFQYVKTPDGMETCPGCFGHGKALIWHGEEPDLLEPVDVESLNYTKSEAICPRCGGGGEVVRFVRDVNEVKSPKDNVLLAHLDEYEDVGRFIVWGGFTGTIDRLKKLAQKAGWVVLRVDGRGFIGYDLNDAPISKDILLDAMDRSNPKYDELYQKYPKICFIGQPRAGGMALTLTASPISMFYSNDFSGEARPQAEDRFHRIGMDANIGALIVDLICLESDQLVLDNLLLKRDLQNLSMGELSDALNSGKLERNLWSDEN